MPRPPVNPQPTHNAPHEPDDRAALRSYVALGDPGSFDLITRRYGPMVLGTCVRILRSQSDAEDAAQETFLKLARNASQIRSNLGAWLHAAAMGCSIDLIRRSTSERRAQHMAARSSHSDNSSSECPLVWSEIEPILDEALSALDDADRDLLVARYLCARTQRDIAREMGLSEGALSRRIQRALERLRTQMNQRGLSITTSLLLAGALTAMPVTTATTAITSPLAKVGLYQAVERGGSAAIPGAIKISAAVALLTISTVLVVRIAGPSQSPAGPLPALVSASIADPEREQGPERPSSPIGPFQIVSAGDFKGFERGVWFRGDNFVINHNIDPESQQIKSARLEILSRERDDDGMVFSARVREIVPLGDPYSRFNPRQRVEIRASFDELGRLVLEPLTDGLQLGANEPRWFGVRPPLGWEQHARIPDDAGPDGLLGPWTEAERVPVTITNREIRFGTDKWQLAIYRIIDWEQRTGYSRVESIHAGGRDPRLIGTRFKLLIRQDESGYVIAYFPPSKSPSSRWPSSFEYSADNPVSVVKIKDVP